MPGSLTLWFKPVLQGFVWSHQSKPMLISPHHFALTGWISVRALFLSRSSEYDNQSHNFKNLISVTSLLFSLLIQCCNNLWQYLFTTASWKAWQNWSQCDICNIFYLSVFYCHVHLWFQSQSSNVYRNLTETHIHI